VKLKILNELLEILLAIVDKRILEVDAKLALVKSIVNEPIVDLPMNAVNRLLELRELLKCC